MHFFTLRKAPLTIVVISGHMMRCTLICSCVFHVPESVFFFHFFMACNGQTRKVFICFLAIEGEEEEEGGGLLWGTPD